MKYKLLREQVFENLDNAVENGAEIWEMDPYGAARDMFEKTTFTDDDGEILIGEDLSDDEFENFIDEIADHFRAWKKTKFR